MYRSTLRRIVCSATLITVLGVQFMTSAQNVRATIEIDIDVKPITYDPMIFGGFIEHFHRQIYGGIFEPGSPLSDERGFRLDVIDALKELKMPIVRWPGGCFASSYHWLDAVGPERTPAFDKAWKVEDPNTFGTDEFVQWCREIGAEPYICVNAGTGTLEEMSDWVEYCNQTVGKWAALRKANGFEEPYNVKYWSIGNENWGDHEPVTRTKEEWPLLVREGGQLMLAADPSIRLFAPVLNDSTWAMPTLDVAGQWLNYVSIHGYWDALWFDPKPSDYLTAMSWVHKPENQIVEMKGILKESGKRHINIAFDEWNLRSWHHPFAPAGRTSQANIAARDVHDENDAYTMADALFSASFFNGCLRNADVVTMANIAPIVNARGPLFVHPKGLVKRTTFHVMQMYVNELGSTIAPVAVTSSNLPGIAENIAAVDAITTIDPGSNEWKVALINRHPESSASISLQFGDKNIDGEVAAIVLSGDSPDAFNDVDHPNRVAPRKIRLTIENGMIDVPPHSLIIIAIQ